MVKNCEKMVKSGGKWGKMEKKWQEVSKTGEK